MPSNKCRRRPEHELSLYLAAKYWGTWFWIAVMYLIAKIPTKISFWLSDKVAVFLYKVAKSRRQITETNIALCFPELNQEQQQTMVIDAFKAYVRGVVETFIVWWGDSNKLLRKTKVVGLEEYEKAQAHGKGVLLLGGHFSMLDAAIPKINQLLPFSYIYRAHNNPLMNAIIERNRAKHTDKNFTKYELPGALRQLKKGGNVWYAFDQDFGKKMSNFAPFFNIPTATINVPAKLAMRTGSKCIMPTQLREKDGSYTLHLTPYPDDFPTGDEVKDAETMNVLLEKMIRMHPEQYLWMHRRFRTRPEGQPRLYEKRK